MGFVNAHLGTPLTTDPTDALLSYISTNWSIVDPPASEINFNTYFGNPDEILHILVENMKQTINGKVLGSSRYTNRETKRIQVRYTGTDISIGRAAVWKMKERIEALLNSNVRALLSSGIESFQLSEFNDLTKDFVNPSSNGLPQHTGIVGGEFLITLKYDKIVT